MPALVLFNRKWRIGSDDFVLPAAWSASIRCLVLIVAVTVYITEHSFHECPGGRILAIFMIGLAVLLSITILLEFFIAILSAQGSILNPGPRKFLPFVLYISEDLPLFVLGALLHRFGGGWLLFGPSIKHEEELRERSGSHTARHLRGVAKANWKKRCQWLCCCAGKDDNLEAAYTEAAEILSQLFGTLDVVPSDVAAGFVLMQLEQQRRICRGESLAHHRFSLPSELLQRTSPLVDVIDPVVYYFKYSAAIYGWPFFMETNLCCGSCQLFPICRCFTCTGGTENDNCCQCNTAAVVKSLGVDEDDVIFLSFHNKIFEIPFMVVIDRERKTIVVAIRGSLSLKDALTDVTAEAERLDITGRTDIYAHRGMVNTAKFVHNKIKELQLLEEAKRIEPDFEVVITGHSLGAGTAILTSMMLKEEWPEIKCYVYSSPFGLLNDEGVHFTKDFVISVVVGLDIIPRLSILTLNDLKDQIVEVMQHSPTPKYRILLGGCWYSLCGLPKLVPNANVKSPLLGSPIKLIQEQQQQQHRRDASNVEDGSLDAHRTNNPEEIDGSDLSARSIITPSPSEMRMNIELYPGGSILWIRDADEDRPK
ncbi:putative sn1-specific diacylglycerol lipase beta-like [Apostichopus japonicus]|uniref:sn-1-specific diacylglycerol lipase n=1 Tax=Stichopus japonicus TaxID=307972 RepID=A0A2G8JCL3_STIJA|nr:putative sn1-specific diacylglycerol lipase beta-like [Apostichopus japonicus]